MIFGRKFWSVLHKDFSIVHMLDGKSGRIAHWKKFKFATAVNLNEYYKQIANFTPHIRTSF